MQTIAYRGNVVQCYGDLEETSNLFVVCEDEYDDSDWCSGNPITGNPFESWQEVVEVISSHFNSPIIEISAD